MNKDAFIKSANPPASLEDQLKGMLNVANSMKAVGKPFKLPMNPDDDAADFFKEKGVTGPFVSVNIKEEPKSMMGTQASPYKRILIIGDSGTGKTHFVGTMPKPFVADFDRGLATLQGKDVLTTPYDADSWGDFKKEIQDWRKGPQYGRETFSLDSLSMASEAALAAVMTKNGRRTAQPTIADWGEAIREMKEVLGYLTTLPCHVVVTAHNQIVRDEVLGDIQYLPLIYGKDLPHRLGIWFDEVYATTVQETIQNGQKQIGYRLQVKPDGRSKIIKSRMNTDGKLFQMYEEPDFSALVAKTSTQPTNG